MVYGQLSFELSIWGEISLQLSIRGDIARDHTSVEIWCYMIVIVGK